MENDVKIYKRKKTMLIINFILMLFFSFMFYICILISEGDAILNYIQYVLFILLMAVFIYAFICILKKKVIISSAGIENIEFLLPPPLSEKKITSQIKWEDIEAIKMKSCPISKQSSYFILSKDNKLIFFADLENTKELVDSIEKKTGKKFEETGGLKKL